MRSRLGLPLIVAALAAAALASPQLAPPVSASHCGPVQQAKDPAGCAHQTTRPSTPRPATPAPSQPAVTPRTTPLIIGRSTPAPARRTTPRPTRRPTSGSTATDAPVDDTTVEPLPEETPAVDLSATPEIVFEAEQTPSPTPESVALQQSKSGDGGSVGVAFILGLVIGGLIGRASWGIRRRKKQQIFG
ncbi:MAG TPA: hypothetical protein VNE62_07825 [Actinomycetota bacterium]|nr:hypothetical protein [Actinomycetota bacterium]